MKWIDINDRLPECNNSTFDAYLVRTSTITRSQKDGAMYVAVWSDNKFKVIGNPFVDVDKITHWMELPEQPL